MAMEECDTLILGAGLAGLAAARALGPRACVLESGDRPGGVARSLTFEGWTIDHTIHLLYFPDAATRDRVLAIADHHLAPCAPEAWVETGAGCARFPLQLHLGGLDPAVVERCLADLAAEHARGGTAPPAHFEDMLQRSFGSALCELFFFPYNRKTRRRPLDELAPSGFQWNIARPDFEQVARGAREPNADFRAYNSEGWYPRPPAGAKARGIEVLARAMAGGVDVRYGQQVIAIDPGRHRVLARHAGREVEWRYETACISTLPLPTTLALCSGLPDSLRASSDTFERNRVTSVALFLRGPRPPFRGHWRYYADESICFNRLIWPLAFDPLCAPADGWGLLAEITEAGESPLEPEQVVIDRVIADARRAGELPDDAEIVSAQAWTIDPAYVVFRPEGEGAVQAAMAALVERGVIPLGRYGRWEYSSMAQVIRDGFAVGDELAGLPRD